MAQKDRNKRGYHAVKYLLVWFPHTRVLHHIPTSGSSM